MSNHSSDMISMQRSTNSRLKECLQHNLSSQSCICTYLKLLECLCSSVQCFNVNLVQLKGLITIPHSFLVHLQRQVAQSPIHTDRYIKSFLSQITKFVKTTPIIFFKATNTHQKRNLSRQYDVVRHPLIFFNYTFPNNLIMLCHTCIRTEPKLTKQVYTIHLLARYCDNIVLPVLGCDCLFTNLKAVFLFYYNFTFSVLYLKQ